tara:strand:- start:543 stop:1097 length:555 start_codon:yes stop_codon:yes gene_type:complete
MPYTKEELDSGDIEFYANFRSELRGKYLAKIKKSAEQNFRDENNVLFSFEDILTGDGIENVNLDDPTALHKGTLTKEQRLKQSVVSNNEVPIYTRTPLLENVVDRSFNELKTVTFAEELPEGIENEDLLSSLDASDSRKWLVQNNQRRLFPDLSTIFASGYDFSKFKAIALNIIKQIPEGEMVD